MTLLGLLRALGELGVRIGSVVPDVSLWWMVIIGVASFAFVQTSEKIVWTRSNLLAVVLLVATVWPLSRWREELRMSAPEKLATIGRLSDASAERDSTAVIESLQVDSRKYLNRMVRRRRNIALSVSGFLEVARSGEHRFVVTCDDRCSLNIDGEDVIPLAPSGEVVIPLEAGPHRFALRYEQAAGPAFLSVEWDTPAFVELLSLDDFVATSAEEASRRRRDKTFRIGIAALASLGWWLFASALLLRAVEWLAGFLDLAGEAETRRRRGFVLAMSLASALAVPVIDLLVWGSPDPSLGPTFAASDLARSALLIASALLFVGFVHLSREDRALREDTRWLNGLDSEAFRWARWPFLALALAFAWLHYRDPQLISRWSREDGPVENASALLVLGASAVTLASIRWLRRMRGAVRQHAWLAALLAFVFFLIGMEEISWGQRIFDWGTPDPFLENDQPETNFHNIATDLFEQWYYASATVFLIVIPFVYERTALLARLPFVQPFFAGLGVAFSSAPLAALNYKVWSSPSIQLLFYLTLFISIYYLVVRMKQGVPLADRLYFLLMPLALVVIQVELFTGSVERYWEITEYKELFIPLGFLTYSLELWRRARSSVREPSLANGVSSGENT